MAEADPTPPIDGIEEGRRLIRVAAAGRSLAERLADGWRQLAWRTPFGGQGLAGRHPLKLLAVPDDPLPGDAEAGRALLAGRMVHRGEARPLDELDLRAPNWSPAFGAYLHGFAWLRDLSTAATREGGAPVAERLMHRWLAAHGEAADAAWVPELWGRRVLMWTAHAPLILSSSDAIYRSRVLNALARGGRHLDGAADRAPAGVPRIAAWCGVVAAGLLVPGGEPRRAFGEAGLARALGAGLFDDGGVVSRRPLALLDAVGLMASLRAVYEARGQELPDAPARALARMVPALLGVVHPDRALSSWQGGGPLSPERLRAVVDASRVRARPLRQSRDWGYQRLAAGSAVLIVDAAPPPVAQAMEDGCASTLAFEFSDGPRRLVVNCGGAGAGLPPSLAHALRSTAAHSTLVLADANSTAVLPGGRMGRGVTAVELSRQENDAASRIDATHDGYVRRHGFAHRRQLMLVGHGRELRGEDQLLPRGRRRGADPKPFAIRFHLGQGLEVLPTGDDAALLRDGEGTLWQFRCRGGALSHDDSVWIDGCGRPVPTRQLVVSGEAQAGGASVSWLLKRGR